MALQRLVQINCPKPEGKPGDPCKNCHLLVEHHGVHFRILKHDDVYDVYSLSWYGKDGTQAGVPISMKSRVLHISGKAYAKFKEFA